MKSFTSDRDLSPAIRFAFIVLIISLHVLFVQAQESAFWKRMPEGYSPTGRDRYAMPEGGKVYFLDYTSTFRNMEKAPDEGAASGTQKPVVLTLPLPDGTFSSFKMVSTPTMAEGLSRAYPQIRTFSGVNTEDPSVLVRVSLSELGLHAMIRSPKGTFFIDPYETLNKDYYVVYRREDLKPYRNFDCSTTDNVKTKTWQNISNTPGMANRSNGSTLHTYRLALAATYEYSAVFGGTKSGALSAMVASVNRVNFIYEQEVSIRMIMIPNDTLLIYTTTSDPYTNSSGSTMLTENQTNIDNVIGSANYDIGHVFSTGGGGVATLRSPCGSSKARGVTGSSSPTGDAYDVDYVAHEMGHQFGANHTFNSVTGSCGGGNRSAPAGMEPGSGITIMAYAGICGADNLDPHSIAYFHTYSFDEIVTFTTTGTGTCSVNTSSGNSAPTVSVPEGSNYFIPVSTPFRLTATGSDPNGDPITYSWEEYDTVATGGAWNAPSGNSPLFRPFSPVLSGTRIFPQISDLINNTTTVGELLPSYARTMKFKVTVRDNRYGGGGVTHNDDTVRVVVINGGGAFAVTSPNTAVTWASGSTQTVTWNVSGTTAAPISCANVKISLSVDGGYTYPYTLLASTANDGTESVTLPAVLTTKARVKVEAVGNIFFDISNVNFTISGSAASLTTIQTESPAATTVCPGALTIGYNVDGPANAGNTFTAQLSDATGSFAVPTTIGSVSATTSGTIACTIPSTLANGTAYRIRVIASNPATTGADNGKDLTIYGALGTTGTITGSSTFCTGTSTTFSVPATTNATGYNWVLPFNALIIAGHNTNTITVVFNTGAQSGSIKVTPVNGCYTGTASALFPITVVQGSATPTISGPASVCQGQTGAVYSVSAVAGATNYSWSVPANWTITAGQGTTAITVSFGGAASSGNASLTVTTSCGTGSPVTKAVTVQTTPPAVTVTASGSLSSCSGAPTVLSFTPQAGYAYQWMKDGVAISGETGSTYTPTASGSYSVVTSFAGVPTQTFNSSGTIAIPDNSCTGGTSNILVSGYSSTVVSSSIYVKINLTHTWDADLFLYLEAPNGQRLMLANGNGSNGDNFTNTVFADSGSTTLASGTAPFTGLYKPWNAAITKCTFTNNILTFGALGAGNAYNPNGTWKLIGLDQASSDTGRIQNWAITFPGNGGVCTSTSNALNVTYTTTPVITSFGPTAGPVGTVISLAGTGFTGATGVSFNGTPATTFNIVSDVFAVATVPAGATTGLITIVKGNCSGNTSTDYSLSGGLATLELKLYIQGFYIPGGHMVPIIGPEETDSIFVELHNTSTPFAMAYSSFGILDTFGISVVSFPGAIAGNSYYIVVKHRNSLETWSKNPVLMSAYTLFNFSAATGSRSALPVQEKINGVLRKE